MDIQPHQQVLIFETPITQRLTAWQRRQVLMVLADLLRMAASSRPAQPASKEPIGEPR
jgi:c-di-GMP-binding flagellar brake protein YcgR